MWFCFLFLSSFKYWLNTAPVRILNHFLPSNWIHTRASLDILNLGFSTDCFFFLSLWNVVCCKSSQVRLGQSLRWIVSVRVGDGNGWCNNEISQNWSQKWCKESLSILFCHFVYFPYILNAFHHRWILISFLLLVGHRTSSSQ